MTEVNLYLRMRAHRQTDPGWRRALFLGTQHQRLERLADNWRDATQMRRMRDALARTMVALRKVLHRDVPRELLS